MGFSPGDFHTRDEEWYHWEIKDGPRIVLWDAKESKKILDLTADQAKLAVDQLQTLVSMAEDGDD